MPHLHRSAAARRISGDALVPDEVSKLLGAASTYCRVKGETWRDEKTGREYVAKTGQWHLDVTDRQPEDVDGQVAEILGQLTDDPDVWRDLAQKFEIDLAALAERGIEFDICLYGPLRRP